ncbi:MAG: hypothetical protein EHM64_00260 [Ignavibacteriae bacterium]|nr:MAG: hypothetical protein EHM64_00260 [Ignavibacteriota bacterium]
MSIDHPTDYQERVESVPPFKIHITSYKIHETYHCSVDDFDPGAVIARSSGMTREEAELKAVMRAKERMEHTRVRKPADHEVQQED